MTTFSWLKTRRIVLKSQFRLARRLKNDPMTFLRLMKSCKHCPWRATILAARSKLLHSCLLERVFGIPAARKQSRRCRFTDSKGLIILGLVIKHKVHCFCNSSSTTTFQQQNRKTDGSKCFRRRGGPEMRWTRSDSSSMNMGLRNRRPISQSNHADFQRCIALQGLRTDAPPTYRIFHCSLTLRTATRNLLSTHPRGRVKTTVLAHIGQHSQTSNRMDIHVRE
jgi:hypothetical protein